MDIRLLEYYLAVAKQGNITRAAEQLHVTQPTISRQLMDLEENVGTPLMIRGKRQVTLTEAGVLFQQRAEEIVALMEKTLRDVSDLDDLLGGTVSIGCVETRASRMLAKALKGFSAQYPKVQYDLYSGIGDDIREKLDQGELDFGILVEPVEVAKYDFFRLPYQEVWGMLVSRDDPLAQKSSLDQEDPHYAPTGDCPGSYRRLVWRRAKPAEHLCQPQPHQQRRLAGGGGAGLCGVYRRVL